MLTPSQELIILLRPGTLGYDYDDLYELDSSTGYHQALIDFVRSGFNESQEHGYNTESLKNVKLTFTRVEKWVA
jgi:hypothetical protein